MTAPTSQSREERSRQEFEAWAQHIGYDTFRRESGDYVYTDTIAAWLAWSAREERIEQLVTENIRLNTFRAGLLVKNEGLEVFVADLERRLREAASMSRGWARTFEDLEIQLDEIGTPNSKSGAIQDRINALVEQRDILAQWKHEQLTVTAWWDEVDKFVRDSGECKLGEAVAKAALRMLQRRLP